MNVLYLAHGNHSAGRFNSVRLFPILGASATRTGELQHRLRPPSEALHVPPARQRSMMTSTHGYVAAEPEFGKPTAGAPATIDHDVELPLEELAWNG